jgi:lysyl-tRNA synthetase class 2
VLAVDRRCLRPLPDKWKGLTDQEAGTARYVDPRSTPRPAIRSGHAAVYRTRSNLVGKGFLEVETPILQQIQAGATPGRSHPHQCLRLDLYLRIAPELYLGGCASAVSSGSSSSAAHSATRA